MNLISHVAICLNAIYIDRFPILILMKKTYEKGDLVITWENEKCIHAAKCAKGLPQVFKPRERPWIQPENASEEEIKSVIDQCPSKALGYFMKE